MCTEQEDTPPKPTGHYMCKHELAPSPNYPSVVVFMIVCVYVTTVIGGEGVSHPTLCGFGMENLHKPKLGNNNTHKINVVTYYSLAPSPLPSPMWEGPSRGRADRGRVGDKTTCVESYQVNW